MKEWIINKIKLWRANQLKPSLLDILTAKRLCRRGPASRCGGSTCHLSASALVHKACWSGPFCFLRIKKHVDMWVLNCRMVFPNINYWIWAVVSFYPRIFCVRHVRQCECNHVEGKIPAPATLWPLVSSPNSLKIISSRRSFAKPTPFYPYGPWASGPP